MLAPMTFRELLFDPGCRPCARLELHHLNHWLVDSNKVVNLRKEVGNGIGIHCTDFVNELISLSGLTKASIDYDLLKYVLSESLNFNKEASVDDQHRVNAIGEKKMKKINAVVAGSCPAFLGNAVKNIKMWIFS